MNLKKQWPWILLGLVAAYGVYYWLKNRGMGGLAAAQGQSSDPLLNFAPSGTVGV